MDCCAESARSGQNARGTSADAGDGPRTLHTARQVTIFVVDTPSRSPEHPRRPHSANHNLQRRSRMTRTRVVLRASAVLAALVAVTLAVPVGAKHSPRRFDLLHTTTPAPHTPAE